MMIDGRVWLENSECIGQKLGWEREVTEPVSKEIKTSKEGFQT